MTVERGQLLWGKVSNLGERSELKLLLVGRLTSQQHAVVSQAQFHEDNFMCCHTEIEAADQTFYLTQ